MFKSSDKRYKSLKHGDDDFTFSPDGFILVSRAQLQIASSCPTKYKDIILLCCKNGWLDAIANMRDAEYTWEMLQK